jgi:hypothetical protein
MEQFLQRSDSKRWQAVFMQDRNNTIAFEGRQPTSAGWSKHIASMTFSFILDMWYSRNDKEHEKDLNGPTTVKARLLAKIEWIKSNMTRQELRHYKYLDIAQLAKTPVNNLIMLAE